MEDALQRLLETERRAEEIAQHAEQAREQTVQGALDEARREEQQFEQRIPELHAAFVEKAESRAEQTLSELCKRYDERHTWMRDQAEQHEAEALEAALDVLLRGANDPA